MPTAPPQGIFSPEVDRARWEQAQVAELDLWKRYNTDDDWNIWWRDRFDGYRFLSGFEVGSMIEVGCGPFAKNAAYVLQALGKDVRVALNDPLLDAYIADNKAVAAFARGAQTFSCPLEEMPDKISAPFDLLICINVLDHVYSVPKCFATMRALLRKGGVLIFGQDLSAEEDRTKYPDGCDVMHPIRVDEAFVSSTLSADYDDVYRRVLCRGEGRNPDAHCATMLYARTRR